MNPLQVTCPACLQPAGYPCQFLSGNLSGQKFHAEREAKARSYPVTITDDVWDEAINSIAGDIV